MRAVYRVLVVALVIAMVSSFATGVVVPNRVSADTPPEKPHVSGSSPKIHLIEDFTATACPYCGNAKPALSRLTDEFRDSLVVLYWHMWSNDPYYDLSVGPARGSWYSSSFGIPAILVDGGGDRTDDALISIGSGSPTGSYGTYRTMLQTYADPSSNMALTIAGDLKPTTATVKVTIVVTDPVPQTNLYLRTALYEDMLFYPQSDPQGDAPSTQRNVVRAVNYQPISLTQGDIKTFWVNFTINSAWGSNLNKLGVAAWVQSDTRRPVVDHVYGYTFNIADILNAAKLDFVPKGMLLQKDTGTAADYLEFYAEVLALAGEHFDMWNAIMPADTATVDDRSLPTPSVLADTPLLLWNLDGAFPALTATERSLISDYLSTSGNLLVDASNLGFEGWTTYRSWFQGYLHGNFSGDDAGVSSVRGTAGDPIGDTFQADSLAVLGSPDRITPIPPAASPFQYPVGAGWPASVRATHDSDSRVVYLGFQYLDNDAALLRNNVMTKIVDWLDGSAPPRVDVLAPDGGETLPLGAPYDVLWKANDVRVPVDGVDVYFSSNYVGAGTSWQLLAGNQPNDGRYAWSGPTADSGRCRIRVVARDSSPETADGEAISDGNFICGNPPVDILTIWPSSLAPPTAPQGFANIPMAALDASVNTNSVTFESVRIDLTGTGADANIAAAAIWADDGDWLFNPASDTQLDSAGFVGGTATLQVMQTVTAGLDARFFLTYDISPTATLGDFVGAGIASTAYITVTAPALAFCNGCPFDTYGGPGTQTEIVVPPFYEFSFAAAGWYLVSFPVVVGSTSLTSVLSSMTGSYAVVRWFDASDLADPWKAYDANRMRGDLTNLDNKAGFWILIVTPDTLHITGAMPSASTPILLQPGWNLVGFPSASTTYTVGDLKTATGATRVEGFNGAAGPYYLQVLPDSFTMTAGEGYWVYLPGPATIWNVPPT